MGYKKLSSPLERGEVALVGAGPGTADLLTCAAARLLADCDVIVYDALVSREVLDLGCADAVRVFAGKRGGRSSSSQSDICNTLIRFAKTDRRVVRLKGGDPFVFGRGGEEIRALTTARVPFRVIPGITAGVAAPAMAGIPVTDRSVNSSLAFLTGHEVSEDSRIDWVALVAAFPVMVFYMAMRVLPDLAARLIHAGMDQTTSVAVIHNASLADESVHVGTLQQAKDGQIVAVSPSIVIVGETVDQRIPWRNLSAAKRH